MKIISKATEIDKALVSLMIKYDHYYIATAWASVGSNASNCLLENKENDCWNSFLSDASRFYKRIY